MNIKITEDQYVDYESFAPGKITYNQEDILKSIKDERFEIENVKNLKETFFDYKDGRASYRIAEFVISLLEN